MNDDDFLSEFQALAQFLSRYEAQVEGRGLYSESPEVRSLTEAWVRGELSKDQREDMISKTLADRDLEARLADLIRGQRQNNTGLPVERES